MTVAGATPAAPPRAGSVRWHAGRRETALFRGALAVVAIALADDAFVHPELGTAAGGHLASGLVPLAVVTLIALAYPRMPAGLRATAAIACGVLALTAGVVDGFRHLVIDRLAGDDVTVMLAGAAGAALVGLGAMTLWRARRHDERSLRRYVRRALAAIGAGVAVLLVLIPAVVAIVATHRAREPVAAADLGRSYERVSFETSDGLRLAGWYVSSRNHAAVIVSPGRTGTLRHARMFARHGYGVLIFDRRGEGESEGDFNVYGWAATSTSRPPWTSSAADATSIRAASARSACPSAGRC